MCGINAIIDFSTPPKGADSIIQRMNDALAHRGPDGEGMFRSRGGEVVLGVRRLAIVDRAGGDMPITYTRDGTEYAIVANAEFFNHAEIREELEDKGYVFSTRSDVEVALFSYIEWGSACVEHLRGQFAFIVYDGHGRSVFVARDRIGIKPLYYTVLGHTLLVSSEPKGILVHPAIERVPDARAIADYFLGVLAIGKSEPLDRSFFEGIRALPPGHAAVFDASGFTIQKYYEPVIRREGRAIDHEAVLRKETARAIIEQLPDEVPYGIALSGGLDSSVIAAMAVQSSVPPLLAAAIRYAGQDNEDYCFAAAFAEREGLRLDAPVIAAEQLIADIDHVVVALDRPYDSPRELGLFEAYRSIGSAGAKVALIGEGADEFNLGYFYTLPGFHDGGEACATADGFRAMLRSRAGSVTAFFSPDFIDAPLIDSIIEENVRTYYVEPDLADPVDRMQYFYIRKFLKLRLDISDRLSMAHSIEARVPFCDEAVIDASLQVPSALNLANGTEKAVLRAAFADILPPEIMQRRKSPVPESVQPRLYRLIIEAFDAACVQADPSVWRILDMRYALTLRENAERTVSAAERGERITLHGGQPLAQSTFRMRHLFVTLTFLRWHRRYFSQDASV